MPFVVEGDTVVTKHNK